MCMHFCTVEFGSAWLRIEVLARHNCILVAWQVYKYIRKRSFQLEMEYLMRIHRNGLAHQRVSLLCQ